MIMKTVELFNVNDFFFKVRTKLYLYKNIKNLIVGFCTEYNTYGMVIQASHHSKCNEVDPPCPSRYLSTDAYKCKSYSNSNCFFFRYTNFLSLGFPIVHRCSISICLPMFY